MKQYRTIDLFAGIGGIRIGFEKAGFKQVRIERQAMNHDGTLYDKVVMAVKKGDK